MSGKISDETKQLIKDLYAKDLSIVEIAERVNVSYSFVYGLTRVKQIVNPETEEPFESLSQLKDYHARKRQEKPKNQRLSDLIKRRLKELEKNQTWLARTMGITHQAVSLYVTGRNAPKKDLLQRLYSSLNVSYKTLGDLLE